MEGRVSVQATTWVWDHSQARGTDRLVLLALADAANKQGHRSCQSANTIANMCKISSRTVQRSIQSLLDCGEIALDGRDSRYQTNVYSIPGVSGVTRADGAELDATPDCRNADFDATTNGVSATTNEGSRYDIAMSPNPITPSSPERSAPEDAPSKPKARKGYSDDFEQWWKHYPSSRNKADAYTEYQKALREHTPEELLRLLHGWNAGRKRDAASRRDGWVEAPPYAERWLKKRRWEDYAQAITITHNGVTPAPPQMSKDEVDQILGGKDYWSCPAPPPGLTIPEEMAWKRERMNEHLESRRNEAMEKLNA